MGFLLFPIIIIQERKANDSVLSDEAGRVFDAPEGIMSRCGCGGYGLQKPHTHTHNSNLLEIQTVPGGVRE